MLSTNQITRFFDHQYIWKDLFDVLEFFMEMVMKGRQSEGSTLVGCSKICLSSNQITACFDHQYLWKMLIKLKLYNKFTTYQVFNMKLVVTVSS